MLVACRLAGLSALEACTICYTFELPSSGWVRGRDLSSIRCLSTGLQRRTAGILALAVWPLPLKPAAAVAAAPQPQ